jgi:uncharacterized membrane protein
MLKVYILALLAFVALDFIWLRVMVSRLYLPEIGSIMRASPDWRAALAFYAVYAFGMTMLIILPAASSGYPLRALQGGAILGLIAYGTYNLTNLATLRAWSQKMTLVDMAWGIFATAFACWIVTLFVVSTATPDGA